MPEGTLSLYSADRRHIKFVYFEKNLKIKIKINFRKSTGSSLRDVINLAIIETLWGGFILANQGVP